MVDEPFHLLHEPQGIPELCVRVERRLVEPLRVNEKQPRITRGGISSDLQTTGLVARLGHLRAQCGGDRLLVSFACVKAGNNYKLYGMLRHILGQYTWIDASWLVFAGLVARRRGVWRQDQLRVVDDVADVTVVADEG